ncbi:MAG: gliding motility-associated ABC transporter permease subunit GldF [Maribacter sp.]|nr:gliding motility-associated ABC transporter permease subunit GldF [Maribacter sp.]
MLAIFKREIQSFFSSPIGYLVIGLFLLLNGLFLWFLKGTFNIFDYGFADLSNFFFLAPWVFLFLLPAITMKSFSEEKKMGTLELLLIKPVSLWQLVWGKFLGSFFVALVALIPTALYVYTLYCLGTTVGNLDMGLVWGSYFGITFLIACYTSIGLFASTLSENQIIAFIGARVLCFLMYYGFDAMSMSFDDGSVSILIRDIGMNSHFEHIALGILDTRDLIYFISLAFFFIYLTVLQLKNGNRT